MGDHKLAEYLKELRIEYCLSQSEMAKIIDCSPSHVSCIENGKGKFDIEKADLLIEHLQLNTHQINKLRSLCSIYQTQMCMTIPIETSWERRKCMIAFMKKITTMNDEKIKKILDVLSDIN